MRCPRAHSYGHLFNFRPAPRLPNHVYRFDPRTGEVRVVAADFDKPNGIAFSPDGKKAYMSVLLLILVLLSLSTDDSDQCRYGCSMGPLQADGPNGTRYHVSRNTVGIENLVLTEVLDMYLTLTQTPTHSRTAECLLT